MTNESDFQDEDNLDKASIAIILSSSVISFCVLVPLLGSISIPLEQNDAGIISLVSALNVSPYTEYIKFLILLLTPILVGVVTLNFSQVLVSKHWTILSDITRKISCVLSHERLFTALTLTLIFLWSVNRNYILLGFTLTDAFHEGEYLGFLPNFLTLNKPLLESFMIHGFGMDVLTSLIANQLADRANVIALTRFLRMTEGLITYLGCFWIIWELVLLNKFNNSSRQKVFLLLSILFVVTDGVLFRVRTDTFAGRDTLFVLQLALVIKFFRVISQKDALSRFKGVLLPFFIGMSIPISVLYVYDRAAYFFLIYLLACALVLSFGKQISRRWLYSSIIGCTASAIAVVFLLGLDQVVELSSQMSYWIHYGKYITFVPPPPFSFGRESIVFWRYFSFATLVPVFSVIYLILDYKKEHKSAKFWSRNCSVFILLLASVIYSRIILDRSPDAGSGSLIAVFLLVCICLSTFKVYLEEQIDRVLVSPLPRWWVVLLIAIIILIHPILNPLLLPNKFIGLYQSYRTPDVKVIRQDFIESYRAMSSEVDQSSCFFTMDSEGLWYYLFNKQSCTKFSILAYAKTRSAQETIVREIDDKKPSIILFFAGGDVVGARTPISDSSSIVYQYVLSHYKPHALVAGRWFWKRDEKRLTFADKNSRVDGSVKTIDVIKIGDVIKPGIDKANRIRISNDLGSQFHKGDRVWLNGTSSLTNQNGSTNAVYLSYGEDNKLISAAWVAPDSTWRAHIPTLLLPARSDGVLRVWGYDAKVNQLMQVGQDIKIDLTSSA